ncbi:hypothetical protein CPB85DRAFT_863149 [Mucidula mucida]|nr:hypothetical protein CPB85DRAFT_863149 [Mucidula mucida]
MPTPVPANTPRTAPRSKSPSYRHRCCQCFHSDTSTINESASDSEDSPVLVYHGSRHSHAQMFRKRHSQQRRVLNDPFDYEQKYPVDEKHREMSATGRVWKSYMDESTKFDVDMVENWRDGLDMLLVFVSLSPSFTTSRFEKFDTAVQAALFSGVVTTFVVQTYQSLNVDYAQVTASLMLRLIDIQVSISQGQAVPNSDRDPPKAFMPKSSDLWINGLWLTSLVLSLATTLIAGLTKQWINEYMVLPSGNPRDRARIRHFRFVGLEQWHVPLIIGLLPILMHVALGVFLAGLVIFACSLSTAMASALGCMTGTGALAYLVSNILPLFYTNCPYKTPLASYTFMIVSWLRRQTHACHGAVSLAIARSLKELERTAVSHKTDELDALAVSWLHNTSSNASVQSIAVQSLGGLPLQSIPTISGPSGISAPVSDPDTWRFLDFVKEKDEDRPAVIRAIRAHHLVDQPADRQERFQRAALRFGKFAMLNLEANEYDFIYNDSPKRAIGIVRDGFFTTADTPRDAVFWGKAFEAALQSGPDFLGIDSIHAGSPLSSLCMKLLKCTAQGHVCSFSNCDGKDPVLFSFSLGPDSLPLYITRYEMEQNGTSTTISDALMANMRPSFIRWVLDVCFPHVAKSTSHLPDDVLLVLTLLQTRSVQLTSLRNEIPLIQTTTPESSDDDESSMSETSSSEESVFVPEETPLFQNVLGAVTAYTFNIGDCKKHKGIDRAAISALQAVVKSDAFGTSTVMSLSHEAAVIKTLFDGLNRRLDFVGHTDRDSSWLTPTLFQRLWHILTAFIESGSEHEGWRTVGYVLHYLVQFPSQIQATEAIYDYLVQHDWLHDIGLAFSRLVDSTNPESDRLPRFWCPGYIYVAAAYVDGIYMYADTSEQVSKAKSYISESDTRLSTLSTILLIAHCPTQNRLWRLGEIFKGWGGWSRCMEDLTEFVTCPGAAIEYAHVSRFITVTPSAQGDSPALYRPFEDLASLIKTLGADVDRDHFTAPMYPKAVDDQLVAVTAMHTDPEAQSSPGKRGLSTVCRRLFWNA